MASPAIAVCCSGEGTNLEAIIQAICRRRLKAQIRLVITDNPNAFCIYRAHRAKIQTIVIDPKHFRSRQAFDRALVKILDKAKVQWIILAGFMRILSPQFVRRYQGRIVNVHPSLLPAFPGAHAVRDALRYGVKVTGVTIHFVDEKVDHGPVIAQKMVPIRANDTESTLHARIHRVEHKLYPEVIGKVLNGRSH